MRRRPQCSGSTTSSMREGDARGLRKRGRRPQPGEAGGCGPEAGRREESRPKRRMVARACVREKAENDPSGEAPGAGKAAVRRRVRGSGVGGHGGLGTCGPGGAWKQGGRRSPRADEETESRACRARGHSLSSLALSPCVFVGPLVRNPRGLSW